MTFILFLSFLNHYFRVSKGLQYFFLFYGLREIHKYMSYIQLCIGTMEPQSMNCRILFTLRICQLNSRSNSLFGFRTIKLKGLNLFFPLLFWWNQGCKYSPFVLHLHEMILATNIKHDGVV